MPASVLLYSHREGHSRRKKGRYEAMKKVYMIKIEEVTNDWGRHIRDNVVRTIYTDEATATALVEAEKARIENTPYWWMDTGKGADNRPNVWAEGLEVEGL